MRLPGGWPKTLWVGNAFFSVSFCERPVDVSEEKDRCWGELRQSSRQISLCRKTMAGRALQPRELADHFFHELLHAISLDRQLQKCFSNEEAEELVVNQFATDLVAALSDMGVKWPKNPREKPQ